VVYLDIFKNTGLMTRITNALGVYLEFSRNLDPIEKHIARGSIRIFLDGRSGFF
jgi:GTP cyclohydrolase III